MFYQMTWDEYIAGDIEYTPKVEKADGGGDASSSARCAGRVSEA